MYTFLFCPRPVTHPPSFLLTLLSLSSPLPSLTQDDAGPALELKLNVLRKSSSLTSDSMTTPIPQTPPHLSSSTETMLSLSRSNSIPEPRYEARVVCIYR